MKKLIKSTPKESETMTFCHAIRGSYGTSIDCLKLSEHRFGAILKAVSFEQGTIIPIHRELHFNNQPTSNQNRKIACIQAFQQPPGQVLINENPSQFQIPVRQP